MSAAVETVARQEQRAVDSIVVGERIRSSLGDLDPLKASMSKRALINPISILEDGTLICGERRLTAARELGWGEVTVRVWPEGTTREQAQAMEIEENECREEVPLADAARYHDSIVMSRQESGALRGAPNDRNPDSGLLPEGEAGARNHSAKATYRAAKDTGVSRAKIEAYNYIRRREDDESLPDEIRAYAAELRGQVDDEEIAPTTAQKKLREALADYNACPAAAPDRSRDAVAARVETAREMAASGHTSRQIADSLGLKLEGFADMRKRHGIEVPADKVVGRTHHIDPRRVVESTAIDLDATVIGLNLLSDDDLASLDPAQREEWADSMDRSLKSLRKFHKRLKESTQ